MDWNEAKQAVKSAESAFLDDWNRYKQVQASDLWHQLLNSANNSNAELRAIGLTLSEFVKEQKEIRLQDKNHKLLHDLRIANPQYEMGEIEDDKGELYDGLWAWVLSQPGYTTFTSWDDASNLAGRVLWIKGPAGMGKTMLIIGIVRQLLQQPAVLVPSLSFFFFQHKKSDQDNATAAMRSLLWMLLYQQPHLIEHLRTEYEVNGEDMFTGRSALRRLMEVFDNVIEDALPVVFLVDALDECDEGLAKLVKLISTSLKLSNKVRWLITSRPEDHMREKMVLATSESAQALYELDVPSQNDQVKNYIRHRLSNLDAGLEFTREIVETVAEKVCERAGGNLLWVSLVLNDIELERSQFALRTIASFPRLLEDLYEHKTKKFAKMGKGRGNLCLDVLMATSLAYRLPLYLCELEALVPWSEATDVLAVVKDCNSFLTVRTAAENGQTIINVIHKSAKDYMDDNRPSLRGGAVKGHSDIVRHSITSMSKPDVFRPERWKSKIMMPLKTDQLISIQYSCTYWLDHLRDSIRTTSPETSRDLCDAAFICLREHFLHWLESLSVLNQLPAGILSIKKLFGLLQVCL